MQFRNLKNEAAKKVTDFAVSGILTLETKEKISNEVGDFIVSVIPARIIIGEDGTEYLIKYFCKDEFEFITLRKLKIESKLILINEN